MSGIPVIKVSDDGFGHAIKTALEHLQQSHAEGTFGLSNLPSPEVDFLNQVQSGRLFLSTWPDLAHQVDQAQRGILRQLEGAGLIEAVDPNPYDFPVEWRLTPAGRQTTVEMARKLVG